MGKQQEMSARSLNAGLEARWWRRIILLSPTRTNAGHKIMTQNSAKAYKTGEKIIKCTFVSPSVVITELITTSNKFFTKEKVHGDAQQLCFY